MNSENVIKLEIKKLEENKYIARFAKEELEISINSEQWNIEGINKFLIKLATNTPNDGKIEIIFNEEEIKNDKVYYHIYSLFNEFKNEYNNLNNNM